MKTRQTDIAIIGAGLTGLTAAFHLVNKGKKVLVIEKNNRIGGQIQTFEEDGFIFESGPNTGAISNPETAELFAALSPACELEIADENANRRLIWKGNRFRELPSGLLSGLTTPLFTFYDKFRILGEPLRKKGSNPDESVAELATRRLGKSFLNYACDPFLSGVYAGDPTKLITRYALPKLYNLEHDYGSFIKGSIAKAKQPKTERDRLATKKVFSAQGGLSRLTAALAATVGKGNIALSASSVTVQPVENRWKITYTCPIDKIVVMASKVITTVHAHGLPELLPFVDAEVMHKVDNLRYAPMVQAAVGIKDTKGLRFNAFGGLVPSREKRNVLGILIPSDCFRGRAPEKGALFSFFIGGIKSQHLTQLTDVELKDLIVRDFHDMLKFPKQLQPDLIRIFRHPHAIAQYEQSSGERFAAIESIQKQYPGLILAGSIRNGIGMADRILQATTISKEL
ncbi:MAG: protoporphyrinogen oxidase [Candidatus Symbiothrix sp.]|jgi:oxygen-dependent protoporphyrinogen oxidase|nr:protoporphyrinogen oxidase [Candidatus Symbiothrix sp.]